MNAVKDRSNFDQLLTSTEPCESTCFSIYVNVEGKIFPCSFCEGTEGWQFGVPATQDFWEAPRITKFRDTLLNNKDENGIRNCPLFEV